MTKVRQLEILQPHAPKGVADQFLICEYSALRDEIIAKLNHIHQIVWLSLISQAAVASWIIPQAEEVPAKIPIFLASLVSPFLAFFFRWYRKNLTQNVQEIASYIKSIEARFLPESDQQKTIKGWEHREETPADVVQACGSFASINTLFDWIARLSVVGVIAFAVYLWMDVLINFIGYP